MTNYTVPDVMYGTSVNVQAPATDPAGYTFSQWTINGAAQSPGQKSVTFTMDAAITAVAEYTANAGYALAVESTPPTGVGHQFGHGPERHDELHEGGRRGSDEREPGSPGDGPGRVHLLAMDGGRRGAESGAGIHRVHDGRRP